MPIVTITVLVGMVATLLAHHKSTIATHWGRLKAAIAGRDKDGLTMKKKLKKQGLNTMLLYVILSNVCVVFFMTFSWYGFSIQQGESPLYPGQWKPFLAVFSGIMAADNVLKPVRLAIALGMAPQFDCFMSWLQDKTQSRKAAVAIALVSILIGTFGFLFGGVAVASLMSEVPIFATA